MIGSKFFHNNRQLYTFLGALFGLAFPLLATAITAWTQHVSFFHILFHPDPLAYIINTAPLFLGLFAYIAGAKQDQIEAIRASVEKELAARKEELQQFFELSPDLLAIVRPDGTFERVSRSFERILEYSREYILSTPLLEFVHPDDLGITKNRLKELKNGSTLPFQNRYVARSGRSVNLSWGSAATPDGRLYAIGHDMTDRIKLENDLIRVKEEALEAAKTKTQFLANMSHEIRTPMNGIIGMTNFLLSSAKDAEQIEQLKVIDSCGRVLLELINNILDFSKLEAGRVEIESEPFGLEKNIRDVIDLFFIRATDKHLKLSLDISPNVPQWVTGDVTRFRQVLTNLVENAIKFTEKGGVHVVVQAEQLQDDSYRLQFSVEDTGIGISEDVKDKLFVSFSQVDASTTRRFGGTGLGLAICKGLCERMGGAIWVESEPGQGSTFHFTILVKPSAAQEVPSEHDPFSHIDPELGRKAPLKILIAEDNQINQKVILGLLKKLGYQAEVANNGTEVLSYLKEKKYDLILMDCHMPQLDGFETTRKIRSQYGKMPMIIAMSASILENEVAKCFAAGMDRFVGKPLAIPEVVTALRDCYATISVVPQASASASSSSSSSAA